MNCLCYFSNFLQPCPVFFILPCYEHVSVSDVRLFGATNCRTVCEISISNCFVQDVTGTDGGIRNLTEANAYCRRVVIDSDNSLIRWCSNRLPLDDLNKLPDVFEKFCVQDIMVRVECKIKGGRRFCRIRILCVKRTVFEYDE